ncbi:MAG TPA: oligopeptide/dipeptide ABC transporter ATP-binding protein, partial [Vicinamibacterales bacterium]|nr:oligopeptide/dipeptide ABC transporter ATP-binding protein [Vicinamibacterales bacterium]
SAFNLSLLLITHDFGIVAETADRVAVMYGGRIVESGPVRTIFRNPAHPYTRGLLASIPGGAPRAPNTAAAARAGRGHRLNAIEGSVPLLGELPRGCAFNPRCPDRFDPCTADPPADYAVGPEQAAKCYLYDPAGHLPLRRSDGGPGPAKPGESDKPAATGTDAAR